MKNIVRKILSIFLLVSLIGVSSVFGYEIDNNVLNNLQFEEKVLEYKNSLKNNLSLSEYKEFENKFNQLTKKQKEELLNLVNNPKKILYLLSKDNYNNGIVSVKTEYNLEKDKSLFYRNSSSSKTEKATYIRTLHIGPIDIIQLTSWVRYKVSNGKVKEIVGYNSTVDRNLPVIGRFSFSGHFTDITDNDKNAVYTVDITLRLVHGDYGFELWTAEMGVKGDAYGNKSGWFKTNTRK